MPDNPRLNVSVLANCSDGYRVTLDVTFTDSEGRYLTVDTPMPHQMELIKLVVSNPTAIDLAIASARDAYSRIGAVPGRGPGDDVGRNGQPYSFLDIGVSYDRLREVSRVMPCAVSKGFFPEPVLATTD